MNVYLFGYAKKENSTAQPTLSTGTLFSMNLKDETSVINPALTIKPGTTFNPNLYNYAYIPTWTRYYFINDWQYLNGIWICYCSVDVLASFKTSIGGLTEYVVRSASAFNGYISDNMYPTHTNLSKTINSVSMNFNLTGFYTVGIINNDNNSTQGAVTYYCLTNAQFASLRNYLLSENFLTDNGLASLSEINKELVKVIYNPYQYIVSCKFFPISMPAGGTSVTIKFGWWNLTGITGTRMVAGGFATNLVSNNIPTPAHPQAGTRGSYLNHAPYTERYIVHPLIGTVLLDSNKIDAGDAIVVNLSIDGVTGEASVVILNTTQNIPLFHSNINLAVDIPLSQINTDVIGVARTAVNSVGDVVSTFSSGNIAGGIASVASGVLNTLEASIPILQSSSVSSNLAMFGYNLRSINIFRNLVDEDNAHKGKPLCEQRQINNLSGFIMCADAHAEINCYDAEKKAIISHMTNGFYYE